MILATLFGGLAGVAGAAVFSMSGPERTQSDPSAARTKSRPERNADNVEGRLRKIERELVGAQEQMTPKEAPRTALSQVQLEVPRAADAPLPDIATQIMLEEELWNSRLEQIENEALDETRAAALTRSIRTDYDALIASNKGAVGEIICKTNLCQMEIDWLTSSDMQKGSKAALHAMTSMSGGCARHVQRDEATMRSTVVFECEQDFEPEPN